MNCAESRLLLHADADNELDVARSLELERHLRTCAACVAESRSARSLKAALREPSLLHRAPKSLRQEVARMTAELGREARPRSNLPLWKIFAFGAAAVALLAIVLRPGGISERDEALNEAVSSHARSLMAQHLTDVASSDQHTVKPWFDGKLDFAPQVKDLANHGFPLIGGRLDYLRGRPVAALVYQRNKHFINVFIWPATKQERGRNIDQHRGYSVINRESGGFHYCLVSDLNEKELDELASLLAL